jgi:LPS O-antigen subunit length determinant protein (WzzB/FepE family)
MWRSKKFIIITAIVVVALAGSIGGIALAQGNGDEDVNQPGAQQAALLERVCAIYEDNTGTAINAEDLQNAFAQAQSEMREEALQNYLQSLVDNGKITQEQADQWKSWWQSRPEDLPFAHGFPGHGMMQRGFGGPSGGFHGCFEPPAAE